MNRIYVTVLFFFTIIAVGAQIPLVTPASFLQSGETSVFSTGTADAGTIGPITTIATTLQKTTMFFNPNPANGIVRISYYLQANSKVCLSVYNQIGQEVISFVKDTQKEGNYYIDAEINKLFPGIYFIRLNAGKEIITKKLLVN